MHFIDFVQWLNDRHFSMALRGDDWPFPIIETVHILGLGVSVGFVIWVDLRLLGITMRGQRVSEVISQLEPLAMAGFVVMFISGILLLLAEPMKCYTALPFRLKVIMLILAGLNVWYFHAKVYPTVAKWDEAVVLPWRARMVGILSLTLWFGIIIAGRWTAYF